MLNFLLFRRQIMGRRFLKEFRGSFQVRCLFVLCLAAATLAAQDSSSGGGSNPIQAVTAASQFFDHDFVNFYAFADGVLNTHLPDGTNASGGTIYGNAFGWDAGGGVSLRHTLRDGGISLNYSGSYHDYRSVTTSSGEQQTLALAYTKRFNRHWSMSANVSAGILGYGSSFYSGSSITSTTPGNPFSSETRFANAGLSMSYAQTRRLSYVFSGSFFYNGYVTPKALASNPLGDPPSVRGVSGGASVLYRLTARTTVGGSYNHSYYHYSGGVGTSNIDSGTVTLSHQFANHWQLDLSGGANHSASSGIAVTPVTFLLAGQPILAYCECPYNRKITSPAYQGTLTKFIRHASFSLTGGQSVLAGNGLYLTSRDEFANGSFSYSTRHTNIGFGGNYSRLSSVSLSDLSQTFAYYGTSASYGVNFIKYISANARWDYIHYDGIFSNGGALSENRISFGISVSKDSVPLTLF